MDPDPCPGRRAVSPGHLMGAQQWAHLGDSASEHDRAVSCAADRCGDPLAQPSSCVYSQPLKGGSALALLGAIREVPAVGWLLVAPRLPAVRVCAFLHVSLAVSVFFGGWISLEFPSSFVQGRRFQGSARGLIAWHQLKGFQMNFPLEVSSVKLQAERMTELSVNTENDPSVPKLS